MGIARDTLIIKHLPADLSANDKEELLKHFGAKEVKCLSSKRNKYNLTFARFPNDQMAEYVLRRLHQLTINGSCLSVEFAKEKSCFPLTEEQRLKDFENEQQIENEKYYKRFIEKLHFWYGENNFKQVIPSHLRYQYPPPDNLVLLNIAKALATVPKFYTQVLHLMNKMNLPCPFGKDILPDFNFDLFNVANEGTDTLKVNETCTETDVVQEIKTSESEISSDEESKKRNETIPDQIKIIKKKVIKRRKFVKPIAVIQGTSKQKKTNIDDVFEKFPKETKRIKLSHPQIEAIKSGQPFVADSQSNESGFGYIHPVSKPSSPPNIDLRDEREEERLEKPKIECISLEQLTENRIKEKDWSLLPVFKNYAEGIPTARLYIKNLAKTVTEDDLRYIYNRYLPDDNIEPSVLHIRLMQEGRMKGQAFVSFDSVEQAQAALRETNGYLLKDKPMVVQFAKSAIT